MLRYVVLRHETAPDSSRPSHWDLMFEDDGELLTWAIERLPNLYKSDELEPIPCKQLAPHRMEYLNYEGPISGDRGTVTRWGHGTFQWKSRTSDKIIAIIQGEKLRGEVTLVRCTASETKGKWTLSFQSLLSRPR